MNAAVRVLDTENFFTAKIWMWTLSIKKVIVLIFVATMVVASAFFTIYVQDIDRHMITDLQLLSNTEVKLQLQWSQLLLEKSALISPARIQKIAKEKFAMNIAASKNIVTLQV